MTKYEETNLWLKIVQMAVLILIGGIVSYKISSNQNDNAKLIAQNQQKLFAMQIFSDKLMGDRIRREATIEVIKQLGNTKLADSLIDISNRATIEILKYDIWNKVLRVREDAIQEYANLYKKYPLEVLDALMPRRYHLADSNAVISIAKFFYYLEMFSDGKWEGTKLDSARFASIKESDYYIHPIKQTKHLQIFMEICLKNFKEKDITYPKKYVNLYENNKPNNMMDD